MTKPRKYTIPPKERQEWRDLVNAQIPELCAST